MTQCASTLCFVALLERGADHDIDQVHSPRASLMLLAEYLWRFCLLKSLVFCLSGFRFRHFLEALVRIAPVAYPEHQAWTLDVGPWECPKGWPFTKQALTLGPERSANRSTCLFSVGLTLTQPFRIGIHLLLDGGGSFPYSLLQRSKSRLCTLLAELCVQGLESMLKALLRERILPQAPDKCLSQPWK